MQREKSLDQYFSLSKNMYNILFMLLSDRIQTRLKKLGKSERGASLEAGLSDSFLRNIREGKSSSPRIDTLEKIATVLQTSSSWLITGEGSEDLASPPGFAEEPNAIIGDSIQILGRNLPVYGQEVGGEHGEIAMNGNVLFEVVCPPPLKLKMSAYAVAITGDSMSPRYEDGEIAFVDPSRRVKKGDYVVAQIKTSENAYPQAFVKKYVRHTSSVLVLEQFNPPKELKFPHERVIAVHYIALAGVAD